MERRPAGVQPTVAPDNVRDGFGLHFAFRPLGVVDVEVEQSVGVLVNQRPREVGLVLTITHLDERLDVDEAQLFADALRLAVGPVFVGNDPHRHAEVVSGASQLFDEVAGVPGRFRVQVGKRLAFGLGDVEHRRGLEPDQPLGPLLGGVSSYSQSLSS